MDALRIAVRAHGRRRPGGVLLSGGIDSSLGGGTAGGAGAAWLKTFSVGFHAAGGESGDEFGTPTWSPSPSTPTTSRSSSTPTGCCPRVPKSDHGDERADGQPRLRGLLPALRGGRKSVKVVQSGQGADEVFAGYDWYPPLANVPRSGAEAYAAVFTDRRTPTSLKILEPEWLLDRRPEPPVRRRALRRRRAPRRPSTPRCGWTRTVMLVDDPVKRVDNMTMAWGWRPGCRSWTTSSSSSPRPARRS